MTITRKENLARSEYDRLINDHWKKEKELHPEGWLPSEQEAESGAKRLFRFAMKKPFKGKVTFTSGNRYTWIYSRHHAARHQNVWMKESGWHMRINRKDDWGEIVHLLSHWCNYRLSPKDKAHSNSQLSLESRMTKYAIDAGFLRGKLKSKTKEKPKRDLVVERHAKIVARVENWKKKSKRAESMLKRAERELKIYSNRHGDRLPAI